MRDSICAFIEANFFKVRYIFENAPLNANDKIIPLISPI